MYAGSSGAVADERYVAPVTAEEADVFLQPMESGDLVHQAVVGDHGPIFRFGVRV